MTDLELTKACAEAMNIRMYDDWSYDPLHDNAQAMALVKKFKLSCSWHAQPPDEVWEVTTPYAPVRGASVDLNRAICECAAKTHGLEWLKAYTHPSA